MVAIGSVSIVSATLVTTQVEPCFPGRTRKLVANSSGSLDDIRAPLESGRTGGGPPPTIQGGYRMDSPTGKHYGCVGIGVGPANLSLASLLQGHPEISNLFLDRKASFGWHDGQQIPGASLQVSLLKDLVSLSDPTNAFSFLSYLHAQGRIYHFINAQFDAVPRQEFRNYLEWASQTNENVVFGEEVAVGGVRRRLRGRTTRTQRVTADNISIGVGSQPWVPPAARGHWAPLSSTCSEFVDKAATSRASGSAWSAAGSPAPRRSST